MVNNVTATAVRQPSSSCGKLYLGGIVIVLVVFTCMRFLLLKSPPDVENIFLNVLPELSLDFMLVADLDIKTSTGWPLDEGVFGTFLLTGHLLRQSPNSGFTISWSSPKPVTSVVRNSDRGMELSELIFYNNELLTFDDRNGIAYRIEENGTATERYTVFEGDGSHSKGKKIEWAAEKDGKLWLGSMGKEFVASDGSIKNYYPMWIAIVDAEDRIEYFDWSENFNKIRRKLGIDFPGYCIHESAVWSYIHKKWFFLPRRISHLPYDEVADESRGANSLIIASEDFEVLTVLKIGNNVDEFRGYSSFKFIPGTRDTVFMN